MHKVGFIGLGIMGRAMSHNILKSGFPLMVYNRSPEKAEELRDAGASVAATPRELAEWADVVIVMVTGPEAVDALLFGRDGVASSLAPGKVLVNMSTVAPAYTRDLKSRLAESGAVFVDAPVSGSKKPAEQGTLVILAGGPKPEVQAITPLFEAMGKKVVHCGEAGDGSMMKMTVNLLLGVMLEGLAEAVAFGEKGGLDSDLVLDTVMAGPLSCGLFQLKESMLRTGEYPAQFPLKHMAKDLRFVLQTAYQNGANTPAAHAAIQQYAAGESAGLGDEDFAAVKKVLNG